ncbi:hypothetical protein D3C71_2245680 [compost metagenome]
MARDGKHIEIPSEHADTVVVLECNVSRGNAFARRAIDLCVCRFLQLFDTADMVMMVVSDQNIA